MMNFSTVVAGVVALISLFGLSRVAAAEDRLAVLTIAAPIYLLPDDARTPLRVLDAREYLRVRKNEGEWLRVDFQDPQFGLRTGYIRTKFVQLVPIELDGQSELVTVDLGLRAPVPRDGSASAGRPPATAAASRDRDTRKQKN
jgi:hypothetical protein